MSNQNFKMIAKTFYGFENILCDELLKLGAQKIKKGLRSVSFYGDTGFMYKSNLSLRTALKILKQKTLKVYPYSIIASKKLDSLNEQLLKIKTKRKRKKYAKSVQKFLEEEFTEELSKLKQSEGQILIKLIHRQTGETAYNLVKKLRNGLKALLYNVTAKVFNMNLKKEFLPYDLINDYYIEDIIQRGVRDKILEYRKPYKNYDLFKLKNKWE